MNYGQADDIRMVSYPSCFEQALFSLSPCPNLIPIRARLIKVCTRSHCVWSFHVTCPISTHLPCSTFVPILHLPSLTCPCSTHAPAHAPLTCPCSTHAPVHAPPIHLPMLHPCTRPCSTHLVKPPADVCIICLLSKRHGVLHSDSQLC